MGCQAVSGKQKPAFADVGSCENPVATLPILYETLYRLFFLFLICWLPFYWAGHKNCLILLES